MSLRQEAEAWMRGLKNFEAFVAHARFVGPVTTALEPHAWCLESAADVFGDGIDGTPV